jgi:hypothetical protein
MDSQFVSVYAKEHFGDVSRLCVAAARDLGHDQLCGMRQGSAQLDRGEVPEDVRRYIQKHPKGPR